MNDDGREVLRKTNEKLLDAIRLKQSINENIRYCGLNAREFMDKKIASPEEWEVSEQWCEEGIKDWGYRVWNGWYFVCVVVFLIGYFLPNWGRPYAAFSFLAVLMWIVSSRARAEGFRKGFSNGFGRGLGKGIDKMAGITETESREISERATEMVKDALSIAQVRSQLAVDARTERS